MDYIISTVPYAYDMSNYISCVKPYGYFTQIGQPINGELTINNFNMIFNRVNFNGSLIGGIRETQEMLDFCARKKVFSDIELIPISQINDAYERTIRGDVKYRFVIDARTLA